MTSTKKNSSKRNRSPSYPVCDLKTAIEKAIQFYKSEAFNEAMVDVAVQCWGLKPGGSSGYRLVAALNHYGLFESSGSGNNRKVKLSELGKEIVVDEREDLSERAESIKRAALNPQIYNQLFEKWGNSLPSDANMRYYLIKELNFNSRHVESFIQDFRSTIEFADFGNETDTKIDDSPPKDINRNVRPEQSIQSRSSANIENSGGEYLEIPIPLICGKRSLLKIPVQISEEDFNLIKNLVSVYLDNMKPAIVKKNLIKPEEDDDGELTRSH